MSMRQANPISHSFLVLPRSMSSPKYLEREGPGILCQKAQALLGGAELDVLLTFLVPQSPHGLVLPSVLEQGAFPVDIREAVARQLPVLLLLPQPGGVHASPRLVRLLPQGGPEGG